MKRLIGRAAHTRELEGVTAPRIGRSWLAGSWLAVLCALGASATAQDKSNPPAEPQRGTQSASRAAVGTGSDASELLTVVEPKVEMDPTSVSALGDDFNPSTGTVTFSATDISIPGNFAIPVELRRWVTSDDSDTGGPGVFKWNIPFIRGNFLHPQGGVFDPSDDWGHTNTWRYGKNCSGTADSVVVKGVSYTVDMFWQGKLLHIPGVTSESFLQTGANHEEQVTKSHFKIVDCIDNPAVGTDVPQQGIIVQGPDGTRYHFNQIKTYFNNKPTYKAPKVYTRLVMVSKIVDRFGNEVNYGYDASGNLTSITASDGRAITITYQNGLAYQASAHGRTWTYQYSGALPGQLDQTTVTLPDGRQWSYTGLTALDFKPNGIGGYSQAFSNVSGQVTQIPGCGVPPANENNRPVTVTSPDGLQTSYNFKDTIHYRSDVEPELYDVLGGVLSRTLYCTVKRSLASKTSSGAGVGPFTWSYVYSGNTGTYKETSIPRVHLTGPFALAAPVGGYPASVSAGNPENYRSVTVIGPDQRNVFYIDRKFQSISEDHVVAQDTLNASGTQLLERSETSFALGAEVGETTLYSNSVNGLQLQHHINRAQEQRIRYVGNVADATFTTAYPVYDDRGRPTGIVRSNNVGTPARTESITYAPDNTALGVMGQVQHIVVGGISQPVEAHTYDSSTALRTSTSKFGVLQASYQYHGDGSLWKVIDGRNNATQYTSYKRGKPQQIQRADGTTESADINDWGLVTGRVDPNGHAWSYSYDTALRLESITPPSGWTATSISHARASSSAYGLPVGHWRQTVSKGQARTVTYFDVLWRPVMVRTYDAGNEAATRKVVVKTFDVDGQVVFESYPRRDFTSVAITSPGKRMQFDALGRATSLAADTDTGAQTTTTEYLSGFKTRVTNPRGKATTQTMWAQDDPSKAQLATISAPEGVSVVITRNVLGNPTSIQRSGTGGGVNVNVTRSYVYDSAQRLCKTLEPEVIATAQGYDAAGNIAWRAPGVNLPASSCAAESTIPAAKKIAYTYDAVNQLTGVSYGDGSPGVTRTYWNDGLLKTITSNGSVWTYDYNSLRKPTGENLAFGGKTYNFAWAYDANGSLSQLVYPTGGPTVNYTPNALGEPAQVSGYASNIGFHPNGAVSGFTFGNNIVHSLTQTVEGTPKQNADGTILQDLYAYDANGNVASITDQRSSPSDGAFSRTMSYDNLDRLAGVSAPGVWGSATYVYDPVDNLRSASVGSRVTTLNYDASATRLTSVVNSGVSASYVYDSNGNIAQKGTQTFTFDLANRIAASSLGGSFAYDGHGRRTKVVRNDGSTHIQVYSQGGQLLWSEKSVAGTYPATQGYTCATGTLVGQQCVTTTTYAATQGLTCNAGDTRNGSTCTRTTSYAATAGYSCPNGGTLNGATCTRSSSYTATAGYSCNSGDTRSGSTCYSTSSYNAVSSYGCPSGGTLNGSTCNRNDNYSASVSYACNSGDTQNGTSCTRITYVSANVDYSCNAGDELRVRTCWRTTSTPATASYNCKALSYNGAGLCTGGGGMANSSWEAQDMCYAQESTYGLVLVDVINTRGRWYDCVFQPVIVYSCPSGTLNNGQCISSTSYAATATYSCGSGTPVGSQCPVTQTYSATASYSCPSGGSLSNSTCIKTTSYAASATNTCPYGGSLSGNSCVTTSTYAAATTYTCPNGGSATGSTCYTTTTSNATATYTCPSGGTPSGSSCVQTSTYAATNGFVCNAGDTLNNGTCTRTTTTAATSGYTCPDGGTLSNNQCVGGSAAAKTAYIYLDGKQIGETVVGGATQYVHTDALGSPVARTNQAAAVLNRTKYEAYGYTAAGTKPGTTVSGLTTTGSNIGFTGHVNDPETDLVYMQQRYYDPIAGRFLSIDPIVADSDAGTNFNRYYYAENNPYKYTDPDGRLAFVVPIAVGALIGGGINLGAQLWKANGDFSKVNPKQVGVAAVAGALAGGAGVIASTASTTGRMLAANGIAGAAISAGGVHAAAAVDGNSVATGDVVRGAILGGIASVGGAGVTTVASKVAPRVIDGAKGNVGDKNLVEGIKNATNTAGGKVKYAVSGQVAANRVADVVGNSPNLEQQPND